MDHEERTLDSLQDSSNQSPGDAPNSNCFDINDPGDKAGPSPMLLQHPPIAQAVLFNESLESNFPAMGSSSLQTFHNHNQSLLQDAEPENANGYHEFSFGVDLDVPLLTGLPMVEFNFEDPEGKSVNSGEFPFSMDSIFYEDPKDYMQDFYPSNFSPNYPVDQLSPSEARRPIGGLNTATQSGVVVTTAISTVQSSQDPQHMNGTAKPINGFLKHSNRGKHLAPKQLPIHLTHPPGSTFAREKRRYVFLP